MLRRTLAFWGMLLWPVLAQESRSHDRVSSLIQHELDDKKISSISISVADDRHIRWVQAFGYADVRQLQPATPDTIYRVGSLSQLITDLAILRLAENKQIDLDAPIARYLPDFAYPAVTLRQVMAHRGGLVREPPVGSYFDPAGASLTATVQSLRATPLAYAPGAVTKYSNAGMAVAGRVLEARQGMPFAESVQTLVLDPLEMTHSSFVPAPAVRNALAKGQMWSYDRPPWDAPAFDPGIAPAINLYSSATELSRLIMALLRGGSPLVRRSTMEEMWKPQVPGSRYGLGFAIGDLDGRRLVGISGGIYGFAASLLLLPDEHLGVVVLAGKDGAVALTDEMARTALRAELNTPVTHAITAPVPADQARAWVGRYGAAAGADEIQLSYQDGELYLQPGRSGQRLRLRMSVSNLVVDDVQSPSFERLTPVPGGLQYQGRTWRRVAAVPQPAALRTEWRPYIGEYGPDENVLYVLERDGQLQALVNWHDFYLLEPLPNGKFRLPANSPFAGEDIAFTPAAVTLGGVLFARRNVGSQGTVFRIKPLRPVAELRSAAEKLSPPREAGRFRPQELVDLTTLDPAIRLDIRYATADNFLSTPSYTSARAFLQRPAAQALLRAHRKLAEQGYGLLIHDAYRPWYITKVFWDATPASQHEFVADPAAGSRHNRGCAVDLSIYDLRTGQPVEMVGVYDEMSPRSYPNYPGGTSRQRWHRELLRRTMEAEGFTVETTEWWHFNYRDWPFYRIGNESFEQLTAAGTAQSQ